MARIPILDTSSLPTKAGIQNASYVYAADAEASDSYAITLSPAPTAYAAGQHFVFKANTANTGAASLNVNALGAKTIKKLTDQDLATGDIEAGSIIEVVYDGTNFQLVSSGAQLETPATLGATINGATDKATPVDADNITITDSAASHILKKLTWANLKATLKTYFDTLYLALAGGTMTGNLTLGENTSIDLDPAASADGKYTGICRTGTAGAALAFGDLVYLDPTDSRWELVDANAASGADGDARGTLGICVLAAAADGDPTKILLWGTVRADAAFPALTINAPVYASETAGDITLTKPTTTDAVVRTIGFGLTADELMFMPESGYLTAV